MQQLPSVIYGYGVGAAVTTAFWWLFQIFCSIFSNYFSSSPFQGWSPRIQFTVFTWLTHTISYFLINGSYFVLEHYDLLSKYKLPRTPGQIPSAALRVRTFQKGLLFHALLEPIILYLLHPILQSVGAGIQDLNAPLPSTLSVFGSCYLGIVVGDAVFYWVHRTLHESAFLYQNIHRMHHEYNAPASFSAEYAHWIEQILSNYFPTSLTAFSMVWHPTVWVVWLFLRSKETYETHSGYALSLGKLDLFIPILSADSVRYHDFHHTNGGGLASRSTNFAGGPFWDTIMGTNDRWLARSGEQYR